MTGGVDRTIDAPGGAILLKADVRVTVSPLERASGLQVTCTPTWEPADFTPSAEQLAAVEQGANDSLAGGPIEGAALEDVALNVEHVTTFTPGSSPQALRIAAASAVRDALRAAGGVLLQPIMAVEVVCPDENTGGVLGDLQARGATILGHEADDGTTSITAECGLSELIGYTTHLRSSTKGRGQFTMEFSRFDAI